MTQKKIQTQQQKKSISKTDLRTLPVEQLREIRAELDKLLKDDYPPVKENDVIIDYTIKLKSKEGVLDDLAGSIRLNGILHPRLFAIAPSNFEKELYNQVFLPLNASFYDLLSTRNTTTNDVDDLQQSITPATLALPPIQ